VQDVLAANGYVQQAYAIQMAKEAGFILDKTSEINANPKDTKDHPFGVWTLPPVRRSAEKGDNPKFDHAKYDAIGESDRMTLRFRKPA
jgi:predicted methyltransferase